MREHCDVRETTVRREWVAQESLESLRMDSQWRPAYFEALGATKAAAFFAWVRASRLPWWDEHAEPSSARGRVHESRISQAALAGPLRAAAQQEVATLAREARAGIRSGVWRIVRKLSGNRAVPKMRAAQVIKTAVGDAHVGSRHCPDVGWSFLEGVQWAGTNAGEPIGKEIWQDGSFRHVMDRLRSLRRIGEAGSLTAYVAARWKGGRMARINFDRGEADALVCVARLGVSTLREEIGGLAEQADQVGSRVPLLDFDSGRMMRTVKSCSHIGVDTTTSATLAAAVAANEKNTKTATKAIMRAVFMKHTMPPQTRVMASAVTTTRLLQAAGTWPWYQAKKVVRVAGSA